MALAKIWIRFPYGSLIGVASGSVSEPAGPYKMPIKKNKMPIKKMPMTLSFTLN
jgi:hypothetical protein